MFEVSELRLFHVLFDVETRQGTYYVTNSSSSVECGGVVYAPAPIEFTLEPHSPEHDFLQRLPQARVTVPDDTLHAMLYGAKGADVYARVMAEDGKVPFPRMWVGTLEQA
jgi:hypothetical protein